VLNDMIYLTAIG